MNLDEIALKFTAKVNEFKSSISSVIGLTNNLDNSTNKLAQNFEKMASGTSKADASFKESKARVQELESQLKSLNATYEAHKKAFDERPAGMSSTLYNPTKTAFGSVKDTNANEFVNQAKLDAEKQKIAELESEYNTLKQTIQGTSSTANNSNLVPKNLDNKPIKDIGDNSKNATKEVFQLGNAFKSLGGAIGYVGSKAVGTLKNKFKDLTKNIGKDVNSNIKQFKKLALGLIGVRTVMSVLTKAVNAYLSFDTELQDSLNNSWNTLGALLAPAIELVARMFAIATHYVAEFVNALTGIDLVARANAKALESQAKANAKANQAQRGLLSMDEITNLPTENGGASANQIAVDDTIKSFKMMDDLLGHLKNGDWHLAGEDIARGINDMLDSIDWNSIQQKAYETSYNFADFLNGLFEVDWSQIGTTFAESVNTWNKLVRGFLDKFSFIQLGKGMGNFLTHFIGDIDWGEAGRNISDGLHGLFQTITTFFDTVDWSLVGERFGDFVRNIDWIQLGKDILKGIGSIAQGIFNFITGFIASLFKDCSDETKRKVIEIGDTVWDIINGAIESIIDIVTKPFEYVKGVFNGFVDAIHSLLHGKFLEGVEKAGKALVNALIIPLNWFIDGFNAILIPLRGIIVLLAKATGKDLTMDEVKIPNIPQLEVGTPNIETEGLYHLHEGEMVVPKKYNPNTNGYNDGSDNKEIIDLLISLNTSMIEYAERPININMNGRQVAEATYDDFQRVGKNRNESTVVVRS